MVVTEQPLVSIIMPAYNAARFIGETIKSIQNQSYIFWELLITDDCSTDNTFEIVQEFIANDERIKLFQLPQNSGAAVARNNSMSEANGRFLAFLDADDLWESKKINTQLNFMLDNNLAFTFTSYSFLDNPSNIVEVPERLDLAGMLKNTIIGTLTVMIDTDMTGPFQMPLVRRGQDLLTWANLLKNIQYAYGINIPLSQYRTVRGSLSNNRLKALKRTWHNYYKELHLGLPKASFYFFCYALNALRKHYKS
ncbi:glycosyltransferase family 2 protein [Latilactobacillus curvatus]|uniref:Putative N-acetylgalactosaminyl-diphosphoundecaprenol glucuronosyltransferase n=1 Tax=Ligilactobacillus acidipiscis TaxID=89059 RepID=A0A1K1KS77_9LACO|nr:MULTISPECIES: glycosyltransferase family 2 protein [Lactobacillaceae]MCM6844202.1 glycosyltransferase family 2 protein [Latilactobacillus curvatus]MCM6860911.1 glycosyltransferase family 2 protein [Latilactobacillus curvatus]MCM6868209.1 glycosyltransferase family 2 protein [Latilactobacillus curvatus]SFV41709.1 Putative N-acetylgalactosaminyl-diphosphoundecaprenol glucuronosyltransferase [Ligilactobacillus acidipiscis]